MTDNDVEDGEPPNGDESQKAKATGLNNSVLGGFARTTAKRFAEYKSSAKDNEGKNVSVATVPSNRHSRHDWLERLFDLFGQYAIEVNKLVEDAHLVTTCERPSEDLSENPLISPLQGCVSTKYWQLTVRLQADGIAGFLLPMSMEKTFLRDESLFERIFLIESPGDENAAVWSFDNKPVEYFQLPDLAKRFFGSLIEIARMEDISDLDAVADQTAEQYAAANRPPVIPDLPPIPSFEVEESTAVDEAKFKDLLTHASQVASNTASGAAANDVAVHHPQDLEPVPEPFLDLAKLEAQADSFRKANKSKSGSNDLATKTLDSYALLDFEDADNYYTEMRLTPAPEPEPQPASDSLFTYSMPPSDVKIDSTFEAAAMAAEELARVDAERMAAEKAEFMAAAAQVEAEIAAASAAEEAASRYAEAEKIKAAEEARAEAVRVLHARAEEEARAEAARVEHARLEEEAKIELARIEQERLEEETKVELAKVEQARLEEEAKLEAERVEQVRAAEEARIELARVEQNRLEEEAKAEAEKAEQARAEEEARVEAEKAEQARAEEEARVEAEKAEQARAEEEARVEAEKAEQAKAEEEARAAAEKVEQARAEEEARVGAEKAAQARAEEEARAEAEKAEDELRIALHDQPNAAQDAAVETQAAAVADETFTHPSATPASPVSWESAPVSWEHTDAEQAAVELVDADNQALPVSSHAAVFEGEMPGHAVGPATSDVFAESSDSADLAELVLPPPVISRVTMPTAADSTAPDMVPPSHDSEPAFPPAEEVHAYRDNSFELLKPTDVDTSAPTIDAAQDDHEIADALLAVTDVPPIKESLTRRELSSEVQKLAAKLQQTSSDLIDTFSRKAKELSGGDRTPAGPKPTITPVTASTEEPNVDKDGWRLFTPDQSALLSVSESPIEPAAPFANVPEDSEFLLSDSVFQDQVAQPSHAQEEQPASVAAETASAAQHAQDEYAQVMSTEIAEAEELDSTFLQAERFASENAETTGRAPVPSFEVDHVYQTASEQAPDAEPVNLSEIASLAPEAAEAAPFGDFVNEFTDTSAFVEAQTAEAPEVKAHEVSQAQESEAQEVKAAEAQPALPETSLPETSHPVDAEKSETAFGKPIRSETFRRSSQQSSKKFQPYSAAAETTDHFSNKADHDTSGDSSDEKPKTFFESLQSIAATRRQAAKTKQEPEMATPSTSSTSNNPQERIMPKTDEMSVVAAIEMMRHSVERELENVAEIGAHAFQDQDMNTVERAMKRTLRIREFKEQLMPALEAWNTLGREE